MGVCVWECRRKEGRAAGGRTSRPPCAWVCVYGSVEEKKAVRRADVAKVPVTSALCVCGYGRKEIEFCFCAALRLRPLRLAALGHPPCSSLHRPALGLVRLVASCLASGASPGLVWLLRSFGPFPSSLRGVSEDSVSLLARRSDPQGVRPPLVLSVRRAVWCSGLCGGRRGTKSRSPPPCAVTVVSACGLGAPGGKRLRFSTFQCSACLFPPGDHCVLPVSAWVCQSALSDTILKHPAVPFPDPSARCVPSPPPRCCEFSHPVSRPHFTTRPSLFRGLQPARLPPGKAAPCGFPLPSLPSLLVIFPGGRRAASPRPLDARALLF